MRFLTANVSNDDKVLLIQKTHSEVQKIWKKRIEGSSKPSFEYSFCHPNSQYSVINHSFMCIKDVWYRL